MNEYINYPFSAIVGQEEMKLALILNVINPGLSGVLIRGEKGTGKSTAVRSLANILPEIEVIEGSCFNLDPATELETHWQIMEAMGHAKPGTGERKIGVTRRKVEVVELPVGATEDRVAGTLDIEHALKTGEKRIEPGILAKAHRNILYVDEVNLLDDHVVDIMLDAAAMGVHTIEREGISFTHPSRFTLVGTMNPEEGDLRPQLLDRFGLCVVVKGTTSIEERVEIMKRRLSFEKKPEAFIEAWRGEDEALVAKIEHARNIYPEVIASEDCLKTIASICLKAGVDGHRADIIMLKAAKTLAAWYGENEVKEGHILKAAEFVLPHRTRRLPMMEMEESIEKIIHRSLQG